MNPFEPDQKNPPDVAALKADQPTHAKKPSEESERWLRTAVQNSSDIVMILEADATIRYVSPAVERMLVYRPEDIVGTIALDYVHPEDLEYMSKSFAEAVKKPGVQPPIEYRVRAADGSWRHVEAIRSNWLEDPNVAGLVVNVRDVTERKQAEERIRESEERFRSLVQNSSDVITVTDVDGTILYDSPAVERVLGYEPEERVGTNAFDYIGPSELEQVTHMLEEILTSPGARLTGEMWWPHKDSSFRYLEVTPTNLLDDPAVGGIVVNWRDITERKQAEDALKESEERFRTAFEDAPVGVALVSLDGRRFRANRSLCEMLGCSEEDLLGENYLHHVHPDDRGISTEHFQRVLEEGAGSYKLERRYLCTDGSVVWHLTSVSMIQDSKGNPSHFICLHQDITERKEAEEALRNSEALNHAIVDTASDGIITISEGGLIHSFNRAAEDIFGYNSDEVIGRPLRVLMPERFRVPHEVGFRRYLETGEAHIVGKAPVELAGLRKDSTEFPLELSLGEVREGEELLFTGVVRDITYRKRIEDTLRASEASLAAAQHRAHLGSWEWDISTGELRWSDEHYRIFGHTPQSFTPSFEPHYLDAIHPEDRESIERAINEAFEGKPYSIDYRIVRLDGEIRHVHSDGAVLFDDEGGNEPVGMAGTVQDITERKEAEERLHHQAFHDLLTDLPNRQLFMDRLKQALRRTKRRRGRKKVAVLFMDLDNFKVVNDSLSHEVGDRLLVSVGERIRGSLRPEDTLARFGGDEFTVLVENVENPADAVRVAERIIEANRERFVLAKQEIFTKLSIGISLGDANATSSPEEMLRNADTAMYQAKKEGLGYRVFEPVMHEQALRRLKMENELQRAIEAEEFVVHYQPIVDFESGEVRRVEALVRWQHPKWGLLEPSEFLADAEKSGLVIPVGERVLEEACRQGQRWQEEDSRIPPLVVSVNLSAKQLSHPDLVKTVEQVLRETGFEASRLSLDITETVYIKVLEGNTAALDALKRLGVCISIDDFGVGYSSLSYLKRLPADVLKIDKSFVAGIGVDEEDTAIVRMIIDLAHTLGMEVVAEGVESEGQAQQLKEIGCDFGQGYYFAKPLSPEAIPDFLIR